ncbi:hypothetical protein BLOT_012265 [Blomia tropicalis]|nr:hypothetical protein BLOT_012265 [Blomia tropicalis]
MGKLKNITLKSNGTDRNAADKEIIFFDGAATNQCIGKLQQNATNKLAAENKKGRRFCFIFSSMPEYFFCLFLRNRIGYGKMQWDMIGKCEPIDRLIEWFISQLYMMEELNDMSD